MHENQNTNEPNISVAEARKALGMVERNYSDEQVQRMIDIAIGAAEFAFEEFQRQEKGDAGS